MSAQVLQRLEVCHGHLIEALDGDDLDALNDSIWALQTAVDAARGTGAWRDVPEAKERALRISALAEAAMMRVNILTNETRERLAAIEAFRGRPRIPSYDRQGLHIL